MGQANPEREHDNRGIVLRYVHQLARGRWRRDGIAFRHSDRIGAAEGVSNGGCITIRPGLTPAAEFAVAVHEYAHELLHQGDKAPPASKKVRETEAEAVAFVVCEAIGLETGSCVDYIHLYDGDKDTLAASLERIRTTAAGIIEGIQIRDEMARAA
jgi:hypothetical protein